MSNRGAKRGKSATPEIKILNMSNVKWSDLERPVLEYIFQKLLLAENGTKYVSVIYFDFLLLSQTPPFVPTNRRTASLAPPTNPFLLLITGENCQPRLLPLENCSTGCFIS